MSSLAKKVLKNNPQKHKRFDELMKDMDPTMSIESQTSEVLRIIREESKSSAGVIDYNTGGEVKIEKNYDYYKDII